MKGTMKAAVFHGPRDMRVVEIPIPDVDADGVLIRVRATGVCGTDVHTFNTGVFKESGVPVDGGWVLGHEFAGDVVEVGANIEGVSVGDRVTAIDFGSYAEYVLVHPGRFWEIQLIHLPDNVSYEEAATAEPLAVVLEAVRRGDPQPTDTALVIGAGVIGLGCLQVLKAVYGVKQVFVANRSEKRLEAAGQLGADLLINPAKEDLSDRMREVTGEESIFFLDRPSAKVDLVLECAGADTTLQQALEVVTPITGRVVVVACYERPSQIDANWVAFKNAQVRGVWGYSHEQVAQAVALMSSATVDRKALITHRFPLAEVQQAFEVQSRAAESIKVILTP